MRAAARTFVYEAPGERLTCPTCASPRLIDLDLLMMRRQVAGTRTGFVSACEACGLVFSNPQPDAEEQTRFYSPDGEWGRPRVSEGDPPATDAPRQAVRGGSWTKLFSPAGPALSVTSPPPGARALDFGCGVGSLLDSLQDCGWDTWGIEPAVDVAFRRHGRLHTIPETPTFDLLILNHVLEHVSDPLDILRRLWGAARPEAHLLVGVPRLDTLPVHRDFKYLLNGRAHITAYTWDCLRELLARAGWAPVADPPDHVSKGAGRQTVARLRVLARRASGPASVVARPAASAVQAFRQYHALDATRSRVEQLEWFRLAARFAEGRRRRDAAARRAQERAVPASPGNGRPDTP